MFPGDDKQVTKSQTIPVINHETSRSGFCLNTVMEPKQYPTRHFAQDFFSFTKDVNTFPETQKSKLTLKRVNYFVKTPQICFKIKHVTT